MTQTKVECKWRNLLQSHKDIRDNRQKTGQKRKTFQYCEEIESIVSKRHGIHPTCLGGKKVDKTIGKQFGTTFQEQSDSGTNDKVPESKQKGNKQHREMSSSDIEILKEHGKEQTTRA